MSGLLQGILLATVVVTWFAAMMYVGFKAMDEERWLSRWSVATFTIAVLGFGGMFAAMKAEDESGPCLREEQRLVMVGKTLVPMDVCVERGTWVEP